MYNKKQNQKPLFAEVKLTDEEIRQQATNNDCKQRDQRIPYIKLTYPNGVTLNLPTRFEIGTLWYLSITPSQRRVGVTLYSSVDYHCTVRILTLRT